MDIPGVSGMVRVSPVYGDTQTRGLVVGGHPRIVQDGLGIFGVRGYSDTGVGGGWTSLECPGWSGYLHIVHGSTGHCSTNLTNEANKVEVLS